MRKIRWAALGGYGPPDRGTQNFVFMPGVVIAAETLDELVPLHRRAQQRRARLINPILHGKTWSDGAAEDGLPSVCATSPNDSEKTLISLKKTLAERIAILMPFRPLRRRTFPCSPAAILEGIFQLESSGMRQNRARSSSPPLLEDISSILALYRPAPLECRPDTQVHNRSPRP